MLLSKTCGREGARWKAEKKRPAPDGAGRVDSHRQEHPTPQEWSYPRPYVWAQPHDGRRGRENDGVWAVVTEKCEVEEVGGRLS